MIKVGDRLTIGGQLVEVTFVMNDKCYAYKPVKEEVKEEAKEAIEEVVEAPRNKRGRRPKV